MNPASTRYGAIGCADGGPPSISSISMPRGVSPSPAPRARSTSTRAIERPISERSALGLASPVSEGSKEIHGARKRELCGAEPRDEVSPPQASAFLQRLEDRIDGREPAGHGLDRQCLAGHDPVPREQLLGDGGDP